MEIVMKYRDQQLLFEYSGISEYVPNGSSRSGYGSDDWFFLCNSGKQDCILNFSVSGEFGRAVWSCAAITEEERRGIGQTGGKSVCSTFYRTDVYSWLIHLHPADIETVKPIIQPPFSRMGPLTDADYLGA